MITQAQKVAPYDRIFVLISAIALIPVFVSPASGENWPAWRGPRTDGTSIEKNIPVMWSNSENVRWRTPLPGKGHASPIVWEDKIFLVTAIEERSERFLLAIDAADGKILYRKVILVAPFEKLHSLNSHASSTPATDGERVYMSFLDRDKMFVAAYDLDGNMLWEARPGVFASRHGYCSSPTLWKD
ncbi:MAG: outer membrane protein assembly factor BamB family protein, partial [Planctomycetota bacterium]